MSDWDIIKQLGKELKTTFEEVPISEIFNLKENSALYSLDEQGNVNGLHIHSFKFETIPVPIAELKQLTKLLIVSAGLEDISPLKELKSLTDLLLFQNLITDISPLKDLKSLTSLSLEENQISDISPIQELKSLIKIDLSNNPIKKLPEWITDFPNMEIQWKNVNDRGFINIYNTPIESPPIEIVKKGKQQIKNWFQNEYIKDISIENYFSIQTIDIKDVGEKKEIYFLGENGVGKTILLQAIVMGIKICYDNKTVNGWLLDNEKINKNLEIISTDNSNIEYTLQFPNPKYGNAKLNVFAYGVNRNRSANEVTDSEGFLTLFGDFMLQKPDNFLKEIERLELKGISKIKLTQAIQLLSQIINIEQNSHEFEIKPNDNTGDFYYKERGTELKFEQLSDGYRSALVWMADLLSRLVKNQTDVTDIKDFKAIVLVDEIDLFLHPRWALKLVRRLRDLFPNIQWFISTHSPIITLGASADAVFYKLYKEDGETKISKPFSKPLNMTANSMLTSMLWNLDSFATPGIKPSAVSDDDYVYQKIHEVISERIKNMPELTNDDVLKMIAAELDKLENEAGDESNT